MSHRGVPFKDQNRNCLYTGLKEEADKGDVALQIKANVRQMRYINDPYINCE